MSNPSPEVWRGRVLDYLDEHARDVVADLSRLVQWPSISGTDEENSIQADLARQLSELDLDVDHWPIPLAEMLAADDFPGVEVDRREAWGLVGRSVGRSDGASLMLNAHVDVVPPGDRTAWPNEDPFAGLVTHDVVAGRGACDMKGGLVAAFWAVRAMCALDVPLRGDVILACVQGEEDGGLGTYATLARGWRADACVIPEPTSLDLVPANAGSLTFRLYVPGLAVHASRRRAGVSAIEKFGSILAALRDLETRRNAVTHPLMARWDIAYPIEVGRVRAGDWSSTVPDLLVAEGRYGVALGEATRDAQAEFEAAVAAAGAADGWLRDHPVRVEWWGGQFAPGQTPVGAGIVTAMRAAHASVSAYRPQLCGVPYGSDLRLLTGIGAIPTVHYGPGSPARAHSPDEQVPIAEVLTAARALAVLALDHCGLA